MGGGTLNSQGGVGASDGLVPFNQRRPSPVEVGRNRAFSVVAPNLWKSSDYMLFIDFLFITLCLLKYAFMDFFGGCHAD